MNGGKKIGLDVKLKGSNSYQQTDKTANYTEIGKRLR
jgi:hypothetical protein